MPAACESFKAGKTRAGDISTEALLGFLAELEVCCTFQGLSSLLVAAKGSLF